VRTGSVRPVVAAPDPVLSQPAKQVDPADPGVVALVADLVATMRVLPGCVGLAAVQVGVPWHLFVLDASGHPRTRTCHGIVALCNAEVLEATRWQKGREGCTSVPDLTGDIKRATHLVVRGQRPGTGDEVTLSTDAFEARAIQHEIDHCTGLLFLDRAAGPHAIFARKVYL
jgi:peptide deformylase